MTKDRARKSTLERFFHEHNMRFEKVLASRIEAIKNATPLTLDNAIIIPHRMIAQVLVEQLQLMLSAIKEYFILFNVPNPVSFY